MNSGGSRPVVAVRLNARAANAATRRPGQRAIWDLAIGVAGLAYLAVVLFLGYYSPIFGVVLIVLAGYEVLEPHFRRRRS